MSNVRWARIGFALLAWVFVGLAIFQVYLAGAAIPELNGSGGYGTHQAMGIVVGIIAIVLLVLSFAGRLSVRMMGASALLVGLMVVQWLLAYVEQSSIAALHPVNGFLVVLLSFWLAWRGLSFIRAPLPVEPTPVTPAPATGQAPRPTLDQQDEQEDRL